MAAATAVVVMAAATAVVVRAVVMAAVVRAVAMVVVTTVVVVMAAAAMVAVAMHCDPRRNLLPCWASATTAEDVRVHEACRAVALDGTLYARVLYRHRAGTRPLDAGWRVVA